MRGKVIRINPEKMFGFIKGEDGNDYFFHQSGLLNREFSMVTKNVEVLFDGAMTAKGYRAENVEIQ